MSSISKMEALLESPGDATPGNVTPGSRIPAPVGHFRRSASVRVRGEKANVLSSVPGTPFPSIAEREELCDDRKLWDRRRLTLGLNRSRSQASDLNKTHDDDDLESVDSFVSNISNATTGSTCEHAHFAKNGTTYSGRSHKYIVHCPSNFTGPEEYLTPTQRANRSIKRLKTLLQLAKDKLREKEQEIFKLTKEVVELKVFKASLNSSHFSEASTPSDVKDDFAGIEEKIVHNCDASIQTFGEEECRGHTVANDTYNDLSPIKTSFCFDDKYDELVKLSPTSPQHGYVEKMSATPDFLLSSLADSGNYDDLASSVSLHSKDSLGFTITPELRPLTEEKQASEQEALEAKRREETTELINMYEGKLKEKKLEYEMELQRVMDVQEEKNFNLISDFDKRLKEEEAKFEERWKNLLRSSEEEKMNIVERFESKLEEEKRKYFENLSNVKSSGGKITDMIFGESYVKKVEEEKAIYETSLEDIKCKFEKEKLMIEKSFDEAMKIERTKFEQTVDDIKKEGEVQVASLLERIAQLETRYNGLLPKYEEILLKNSELEKENEELKKSLDEQEERHRSMYLKMYLKGQEAAKLEHADRVVEFAEHAPTRVSVPEMLVQLKITEAELENLKDQEYRALHTGPQGVCLLSSKEAISLWMLAARKAMYKRLAEAQARPAPKEKCENDPEATLQFLKSAVYYFLTDRDNHLGHLRAIESILGFSSNEKCNIEKCYVSRL